MYSSSSAKQYLKQIYGRDPEWLCAAVARRFSGGDDALACRLERYAAAGWLKFPSAMLSAVVDERALPISCFLTHVDDTVEGLVEHVAEVSRISVRGGGLSGDWSSVRPANAVSPGPLGFMHVVDAAVKAFRQGTARRGNYAAYMDISHPSIGEFIAMRLPDGDMDRKNMNLHHAVNISDRFMRAVQDDDDWDLVCPATGDVRSTDKARRLWEHLLETRYRTGEPYLNFIDTVNRHHPTRLADQGYVVRCSNLCNEIHLPTGPDLTAVCCLSSVNLAEYDAWRDTSLVGDVVEMLDNALQDFIDRAPPSLSAAVRGAEMFRPLGVGVLGLAQLYQRRGLPFDSDAAATLNVAVFSSLKEQAVARSRRLATTRGEAPAMRGSGQRHSHLLAVAPTANAATLLETSPSVEPWPANAYTNRTKSGSVLVKNPELVRLLASRNLDTPAVWAVILADDGSVRRIDGLTPAEKDVYKTAYEVDQMRLIQQAGDRQAFLCQGQALTLFLPRRTTRADLHALHMTAWQSGCKGLYYVRTKADHKVEQVVECAACQA